MVSRPLLLVTLCLTAALVGTSTASAATVLVGSDTVRTRADSNSAGVAEAFRTTAAVSGTVGTLSVYVDSSSTASKVYVGLYTNNNGHPGTLLTQGSKTSPTSGWNDVSVSTASVTAGTTYWIAVLGPSGVLAFRDQPSVGAGSSETAATTGLSSLPASWVTGKSYRDGNLSAYGSPGSGTTDPPILQVTPSTMTFTATAGGANPANQSLQVANAGGGTLSFSVSEDQSWLSVSPTSGTGATTLSVSVATAGLSAGGYDATITVTASGVQGSPAQIPVHLTLNAPQPPVLSVTPASLSFTATTGAGDPATQSLQVANTGGGSLSFTASDDQPWLSVTPSSGSAPATLTVAASTSGLSAGGYDGTVTVTSSGNQGSPASIPVHLTVSDAAPAGASDWLQIEHDSARSGFAAGETALTPALARNLAQVWSASVDGKITAQPLFASDVTAGGKVRDVVVVFTSADSVYEFDAGTGQQLWRRNFSTPGFNCAIPGGFGIVAPGVIDKARGRVYAITENGAMRSLSIADGADAAAAVPIISSATTNRMWGGINQVGTTLFVATASDGCDTAPWRGKVLRVDVSGAAPALVGQWDVVPGISAPNGGGGIWGYGGVSTDPATGNVFASPGADSNEGYTPYADRIVALTPNLSLLGSYEPPHPSQFPCGSDPCDVDFGATPVVFKPSGCPTMVAAGNKDGNLYVAKATTIASSGQAEQTIRLNPANDWLGNGGVGGVPAWSPNDQMLYVTDAGPGVAGIAAGVVGLKANPDCTLSVAWSQPVGASPSPNSTPTVANGVVYVGEGSSGRVRAFDAQTGAALWQSAGAGAAYAAPIVANGTVYQGAWAGTGTTDGGIIRAFRPSSTTVLLGDQGVEAQRDSNTLGRAEAFQTTAVGTGSLARMSLYLDAASTVSKVTLGVYTDNNGHPGTLITQGSTTTLNAGAWNEVAVPGGAVTTGTRYWFAVLGTGTGCFYFGEALGGFKC
jgi:outer membrane protein assembly factor BamB